MHRLRILGFIVKQVIHAIVFLAFGLTASLAFAAPAPIPKLPKDQISVDFAGSVAVIDLKDLLTAYGSPAGQEKDNSRWYVMSATNGSVRPVTRVLTAEDPPNAALHIFPRRDRPEILNVASSDSGVTVERLHSIGRHAFLVTIPPATSVSLALRVAYGDERPAILAWTESSIVAHSRQVAIFFAAVAGLIAAALAIMGGVAIITAHPAPAWTAVLLAFLFLARLADAGVLDAGWVTKVGGPYGLTAMLCGLALAAGLRLTEIVAPAEGVASSAAWWKRLLFFAVVVLSLAAFVGVPGATMLTNGAVVAGVALIAAYLVRRGIAGSKAARVVGPAAAVFALLAAVAAAAALGAFQANPMAAAMISGFTAAGAVLLALAIAAGEGIAILPLARQQVSGTGAFPPSGLDGTAAAAVRAAHQAILDLDFAAAQVHLSAEAAQLLGLSSARKISHDEWVARIDPDDRPVYLEAVEEYRANPGVSFRMEFRVRGARRQYIWVELRATMLGGGIQGSSRCLGLMADVTSRKNAEPVAPAVSHQDALSGLGNRLALLERLEGMQADWSALAFAILDVDRFKAIHASLGDAGGDRLLTHLTNRIESKFASVAECFRVGGDSFAVLVPGAGENREELAAELLEVVAAPFTIDARSIFASASVGVVSGRDAEDPLELLNFAEIALQFAKRRGGGCYKVFGRGMEETAHGDAVALETDLRRGLSQNEFIVYYQPIVRLEDGSVAGFEALLRWRHPERGLVSPEEFIAHSEETGLIVSLGRFALERTASDLADWQRYFPVEPPLFASVNISRRQLREENFAASVGRLLSAGKFRPGSYKLEITESAIELDEKARNVLERLHRMGAGLAIDDFGTGLSTLSHLKDLPVDTIKVDRSFLARRADYGQAADASTVVRSILTLGRDLNRTVIVEGVEQERDAMWLKQLGCKFAQGFHFSPPLAPDEALKYIATHFRDGEDQGERVEAARQQSSGMTGMG